MKHFRTFLNRFRSWWRQRAVKQEIDEELRFHLEQRTAENIAAGMTPEEAARQARKRFGNFQSVREECRELRGASLFEATWKDIKFGARMLERNWGFTIVAMLMFALGIGALSAVLSLIQGVLLTPPPYPEPQRVMLIQALASDSQTNVRPPTTEQWTGWQKQSQHFRAWLVMIGVLTV